MQFLGLILFHQKEHDNYLQPDENLILLKYLSKPVPTAGKSHTERKKKKKNT